MNAMIVETNMAGTITEANDHNINPDCVVRFAATIFDCDLKLKSHKIVMVLPVIVPKRRKIAKIFEEHQYEVACQSRTCCTLILTDG